MNLTLLHSYNLRNGLLASLSINATIFKTLFKHTLTRLLENVGTHVGYLKKQFYTQNFLFSYNYCASSCVVDF